MSVLVEVEMLCRQFARSVLLLLCKLPQGTQHGIPPHRWHGTFRGIDESLPIEFDVLFEPHLTMPCAEPV